MANKKLEFTISLPSQGLSAKDVIRFRQVIDRALRMIADELETDTNFDCAPALRMALAAGLRGDARPPTMS